MERSSSTLLDAPPMSPPINPIIPPENSTSSNTLSHPCKLCWRICRLSSTPERYQVSNQLNNAKANPIRKTTSSEASSPMPKNCSSFLSILRQDQRKTSAGRISAVCTPSSSWIIPNAIPPTRLPPKNDVNTELN